MAAQPNPIIQTPQLCPYCQTEFPSFDALNLHVMMMHSQRRRSDLDRMVAEEVYKHKEEQDTDADDTRV
jgi:hypothetical protein